MQKETVKRYPLSPDASTLANSFADYFACKIFKTHSAFGAKRVHSSHIDVISSGFCSEFTNFHAVYNNNNNNNNNNNLFIYSALFNMLGDQKRIVSQVSQDTIQAAASKLSLKSCNLDPLNFLPH